MAGASPSSSSSRSRASSSAKGLFLIFALSAALLLSVPEPALGWKPPRTKFGSVAPTRGIHVNDRQRYKEAVKGQEFTCFDGSRVIDVTRFNDDHCDCADGSDEPGTSACANGRFYCHNANHRSKTISSMFVDDGVCDCCDGTDEREHCENTCLEEGAVLRKELEEEMRAMKEGLAVKAKLLSGNTIDRDEVNSKVAVLQKKINATSILVDKLKAKASDLNRAVLEEKAAKLAVVEEYDDEDEDEDGDTGDEEYDAMMKEGGDEGGAAGEESDEDIGRKVASRWTRDPAAAGKEGSEAEAAAQEKKEPGAEGSDAAAAAAEEEKKEEEELIPDPNAVKPANWDEDEDGVWEPPMIKKGSAMDFDYSTFEKEAETIVEGKQEADSFFSIFKKGLEIVTKVFEKSEEQKIQDELAKQLGELSKMRDELKESEGLLTHDFGEDNKFLAYYGKCFKKVIDKYTYEVCPFGSAKQDHTNLGVYKGFGDDQQSFIFGDGTSCWNGPKRSIHVKLVCGVKDEILTVAEPNMCEYVADFSSPLVCDGAALESKKKEYKRLTGKAILHDEL